MKALSRNLSNGIFVSILMLLPSHSGFPQSTIRGLSMGGALPALARGVHAPAWNPANLGLPDNPKFSYTFVSLSAGIANNSFDRGDVYDFEGRHWSLQDKNAIFDLIPDKGLKLNMGVSARLLSMSINRFALTIEVDADGWAQVDKTFFDLFLNGNYMDRDYTFHDVDGRGTGVASIGFSWGQPFEVDFADVFAVGATFKMLHGIGYASVDSLYGLFRTDTGQGMRINGAFKTKMAVGNFGWGINLGAAAVFQENWTASLSLSNLFGSLPWERNVEKTVGYYRGDSLWIANMDDEESTFEDSIRTEKGGGFNLKPPTVLRIGGAYTDGKTTLTADYVQGFREGLLTSTTPQFSVGTEWRGLSWFPLRAGVIFGGRMGFGTSVGLGFRPPGFYLDFGMMSKSFILLNTIKGFYIGFDMGLYL